MTTQDPSDERPQQPRDDTADSANPDSTTPPGSADRSEGATEDIDSRGGPDQLPLEETAETEPADELPEYEPLTPELVEEEAIRGDFMLRWSAVLIALLLGWTVIDQTDVLVQVKTGQYLANHGGLPPRTDVFSSTASERAWINLNWLHDLLLAGVYAIGGWRLLSVTAALLAATTFWLIGRISVPGVPTWWGSVCAALAAIAAFSDLTPGPELITLLGTAVTLWWLHSAAELGGARCWGIMPVFVVWSNLDPRAWVGVVLLIAFAVGELLDGPERQSPSGRSTGALWKMVVAAAVGLVVHPFHIHAFFSAARHYTVDYPAMGKLSVSDPFSYLWRPLLDERFWRGLDYFSGTGLLLAVIALSTILLNWKKLRTSHVLLFLTANGLAVAGARELAVAAMVNSVLATLNAQVWYRESFRQEYSVELGELLFSRGGRALTVLAFFSVGYAAVSGHLMGRNGRRVGMGLGRPLQNTIASLRDVVAESFDDRPFNFRLAQGDVLIWIGQRPFVDSRVRVYAGEESLLDRFEKTRYALRQPSPNSPEAGDREAWRRTFDAYQITHVLPRLSGPRPDYRTYADLLQSPDWVLTRLGAAAACFYRRDDPGNEALTAYVTAHDTSDQIQRVFRAEEAQTQVTLFRSEWPRSPSIYDRYVYLQPRYTSNELQVARHLNAMLEAGPTSLDNVMALSYEALRRCHAGLSETPNAPEGYWLLARVYGTLDVIERQVLQAANVEYTDLLRYFQAISNYHLALVCDAGNAAAHYDLFRIYQRYGRIDLALQHLRRFEEITGQLTNLMPSAPTFQGEQERGYQVLTELTESTERIRERIQSELEQEAPDRIALAAAVFEVGCPKLALEVLEGDLTAMANNPSAQFLYGQLLLEVGRSEEASQQLLGLQAVAPAVDPLASAPIMAFTSAATGDLLRAMDILREEHERLKRTMLAGLMTSPSLTFLGPILKPDASVDWSGRLANAVRSRVQWVTTSKMRWEPLLAANEFRTAVVALEAGRNEEATELLKQLVDRDPNSAYRPLARVYLNLLTGADIGPRADPEQIPIDVYPSMSEEAAESDS